MREAATNAYLAQIPSAAKARSDAYFEGGYWLILWDFLYGAVVALLLLNLDGRQAMRDLAERVTRFKPIQTMIYWVAVLVLASVLTFPRHGLRGLFPRAQIRAGHPDFRSLDGRSG